MSHKHHNQMQNKRNQRDASTLTAATLPQLTADQLMQLKLIEQAKLQNRRTTADDCTSLTPNEIAEVLNSTL